MDARRMLARSPTSGLFASVIVAMSLSAHTHALASGSVRAFDASSLPSFTAEVVVLAPGSDDVMDRSRLEFSGQGMRMIRRSGADRQVLLRKFSTGQVWLVDPRRSIQHEVRYKGPVVDSSRIETVSPVSSGSSENATDGAPAPVVVSGLLSPLPCMQYPKLRSLPIDRWRGQFVSAWGCLNASGDRIAIDYFSDMWGLVVRSEIVGFEIEELRGITALEFPPDHFNISPQHVHVSLDELIHGASVQNRKYE